MDKAKREQEVREAHQRKLILDNPAFEEAVKKVREDCVKVFKYEAVDDEYTGKVLRARAKLDALAGVVRALQEPVDTGTMATMSLEDGRTKH